MARCSTDHIGGENQTIEIYLEVLTIRAQAFVDWVKEHPLAIAMIADESDWDDAYIIWLERVESGAADTTSFEEYLAESE